MSPRSASLLSSNGLGPDICYGHETVKMTGPTILWHMVHYIWEYYLTAKKKLFGCTKLLLVLWRVMSKGTGIGNDNY